jgi:alpha-galactosidase
MLHVIWPRILEMEHNLEAYRTGDRTTLMSMLLWDHRTSSVEQAEAMLEETMALPFNRDLAEHFRARRIAATPAPQLVGGNQ